MGGGDDSKGSMEANPAETPSSGDIDPEVTSSCSQLGFLVDG